MNLNLIRGLALGATGIALSLAVMPAKAQGTGDIHLQGTRGAVCTIVVHESGQYATLPFTNGAHNDVSVGSVDQDCNRLAGYKLWISSANCVVGSGAQLKGAIVSPEQVHYTVKFDNPNTAGAGDVDFTGLLATVCNLAPVAGTIARDVSNYKVPTETSDVFISYTVPGTLGADTYTDVLTINMVLN